MNELDIAERVMDAQVNPDPAPDYLLTELNPDTETDIGAVPVHLRHLWILADTLEQAYVEAELRWKRSSHAERMEARRNHIRIRQRKVAVRIIFYDSLMEHVSDKVPNGFTIAPRRDWRVAMYQPQQEKSLQSYTNTIDRNKLI